MTKKKAKTDSKDILVDKNTVTQGNCDKESVDQKTLINTTTGAYCGRETTTMLNAPASVHENLMKFSKLAKDQKGQKMEDFIIRRNSEVDRLHAAQLAVSGVDDGSSHAQSAMMKKINF
ncbi:hypothetical protein A3Q56_07395 [Intoshia linei]|uniref:Uncharacterized protein n=1 Tax=Intoshia linei TaxID=1819745 RepID=A0A177AU43_9BILA|nr:hypothetical protein A3Q56_07395 [Intoshia linei]